MIGSHCSLKRMYQKNVTLKQVKCKRILKKKPPGLEKKQIGHILNIEKMQTTSGGMRHDPCPPNQKFEGSSCLTA